MSGSDPLEVQIFGVRKSADTRKALRFFAERRVHAHFVDLDVRPASPGELRRFAQRFGVEALLDRDGRHFADLGLRAAQYGEDRWLDRLAQEPLLLRMPLVRAGQRLSIGAAEDEWRRWVATRLGPDVAG
jgi:arsenate reductase-like glutaredoxin family protein